MIAGDSDQNGGYAVRGLPPGSYIAVALDRLERDDPHDPEYLNDLRRLATPVTLTKGETTSLQLKLTVDRR